MNLDSLEFIGYMMYFNNISKEKLDALSGINLLMYMDEYKKWKKKNIKNEKDE